MASSKKNSAAFVMPAKSSNSRKLAGAHFAKGGAKKKPIKKYQYEGTVTKGEAAGSTAKSGAKSAASAATRGFATALSNMTPAQRAAAAKKAGNAAAERIYKSEGADINPALFGIQETVRPYMNLPTVKDEMDEAGRAASRRVMTLKKEKRGGTAKAKPTMKRGGSMKGKKC